MDQFTLNLLVVGASFALHVGIAIWARAGSTADFYAASRGVNPVINGAAPAADWMSAASVISMAGLIAFVGYGNAGGGGAAGGRDARGGVPGAAAARRSDAAHRLQGKGGRTWRATRRRLSAC